MAEAQKTHTEVSGDNKNNLTAVLNAPGELKKFHFEKREIPKPPPRHVLVKVHSVGICGSDVHYWAHGKCGPFIAQTPLVLGHESSGIIVDVGENVKNVKVGDRVAIEAGVPCRHCRECRRGQYNLCQEIVFHGTPPIDGTLRQYIVHPADFVYPMTEKMTMEEGALLEPLSVAVHACKRGGVTAGSHVLITGAGPIGLVCLLVARACGATKIMLTDVATNRLEVAKKLGADAVFQVGGEKDKEALNHIHQFTDLITHTMECSGFDSAMTLAIRATSPGGKILSIGRGTGVLQNIPLFEAADKEVTIEGSFRYHNSYPLALELVSSGQVNVKPLVTHHYTLKEVQEAFQTSCDPASGAIKVVIKVADDEDKK